MTPAAVLDKLLPRWRTRLSPRHSPEYINGFIARNRSALEAVVARAMILHGVKRGAPPKTADAYAAYARLVQRERPRDADTDKAVLHRLFAQFEKLKCPGRAEPDEAAGLQEGLGEDGAVADGLGLADGEGHPFLDLFVEGRAEAILLRGAGWDAVPLLLREPAIAIVQGEAVVGFVDVLGVLHMAPGFERTEQLRHDVTVARERVEALTRELADPRLERFALALWSRARAATPPSNDEFTSIVELDAVLAEDD